MMVEDIAHFSSLAEVIGFHKVCCVLRASAFLLELGSKTRHQLCIVSIHVILQIQVVSGETKWLDIKGEQKRSKNILKLPHILQRSKQRYAEIVSNCSEQFQLLAVRCDSCCK